MNKITNQYAREQIHLRRYLELRHEEVNLSIFEYIEEYYNRRKMRSAINYYTPLKCEYTG